MFLAVYHKKEKNTILTRLCKQGQQLAKCIWLELKLYDILDDCQGALNHHMFIRIFPLPVHFVNFNIGKNKNRFRLLNDLNIHQPFKNLYFLLKSELVLAHLRWNLKWAFLINFCLASVCPWVCLKINFFFTFSTFSKKNYCANFN